MLSNFDLYLRITSYHIYKFSISSTGLVKQLTHSEWLSVCSNCDVISVFLCSLPLAVTEHLKS